FFTVVEVNHLIARYLVGLVSLAGDHDHVVVRRLGDRARDRLAAVGDRRVLLAVDAVRDLVDDRARVFAARVIARDYDAVGEPRGDLAHLRTLAAIAIAAAAEDDRDLALLCDVAHRVQQFLARGGL